MAAVISFAVSNGGGLQMPKSKIQVHSLMRAGAEDLYVLVYTDPDNPDKSKETQKQGSGQQIDQVMRDGGLSNAEIENWFKKAG